ncbi:ABC transporter permease [Dactylosporangium sp. NPDC005572]|uniref:ABC transporter permease n=1 Tax=Dactylosporangium sp. NPDC005572 TaxID=3156889 RepID=UPI0033A9A7A6
MRGVKLVLAIGQVAVVVGAIALWQWLSDAKVINTYLLGQPNLIARQLHGWFTTGTLWTDVGATLLVLVVGYTAGLTLGAVLGAALGLSPFIRAVLEPFVVFFNGMPRLLLYPLLLVVIGIGTPARIVLVVAAVFVIVAVSIAAGLSEIPIDLLHNMLLAGASKLDLARHVYLPSLTIWILSTARTTIGIALSATLLGEFVGATKGIGYQAVQGQANLDVNQIWAAITLVVAVALVFYVIVGSVERRATKWLPTR